MTFASLGFQPEVSSGKSERNRAAERRQVVATLPPTVVALRLGGPVGGHVTLG
ncbi:hypothetical protein RISK_002005 [Rhodopirellula islandica]|uniref:Uncharacterized protein n=1 Tax=Rhodopirellula islandica TaxID=595434 RepID=A0A0J1EKR6_RHOIS|nr:hypothetical protein RISK_002005 [Rhodopirellula islandica]